MQGYIVGATMSAKATAVCIQDLNPSRRLLRDRVPVFWSGKWHIWIAACYDDVRRVFNDHEHFFNDGRFTAIAQWPPVTALEEYLPLLQHSAAGMLPSDPPDHGRLRNLIRHLFSVRVIRRVQDREEVLGDGMLAAADALDAAGSMAVQ